jgi:hypothetical protein
MGWHTQDRNDDATVKVSGDYVRDQSRPDAARTDFLIFDKTVDGEVERTHISIDADGDATIWDGNDSILGS